MAKPRRVYVCRECGAEYPSWTGRCQGCQAWASVGEMAQAPSAHGGPRVGRGADLRPLASVEMDMAMPFPVGVDEIDRVLGGGLTPGSVTLLAGEPGVGKSTLTLQIAMSIAAAGSSVMLVAGEEAPTQVAARASRLGPIPAPLTVIDELSTDAVVAAMGNEAPQLVIVDSVQTLFDPDVDSAPGSVTQVKAVAGRLVAEAKKSGVSVLLVGHVTKEGSIAGPRVLEHMVDTVLSFDGERHSELRFLRTIKHRFGSTNEVGIFDMTAEGLFPVPDPSTRYLQDRQPSLAGSVVVPILSGRRPVLVEIQALAVDAGGRPGHVTVQGVDGRRAALVSAVLASRAGYRVQGFDLFLSAAGGASVDEPAADLGLALAIASAIDRQPVSPDVVICGEIGLGGELRSIPLLEQRLQESYRMGFRTAVAPTSAPEGPTGLRIMREPTVGGALAAVPQHLPV
ncbi:MAG: DNA repair protein RadA [Acidimicrobiales bacterium]